MITGRPIYVPESLVNRTLGKYHVKEILGQGGMGVVFKVWDTLEDRPKAIKMVPPELASSPLAFEELKREISLASSIIHPNVVKVLSLEAQDGQYFIVMEYIAGESLETKMAWAKERRLKETEVIRIMKKAAEGVAEAHAKMIIHRDLKPRNIMESYNGEVKVLDFGISHRISRTLTEITGVANAGTWPYMAPEQLSNNFGREDQQVDIWAMGVTMYQLLSGEIPFRNREQITDLKEKPFPLENISKKISFIVMKCLEKDRKKRYQHMIEVIKDLETVEKSIERKDRFIPLVLDEGTKEKGNRALSLAELLEWPRMLAVAFLILAVLFLYYSLRSNNSFRYDMDVSTPYFNPITEARQDYENNIKEAQAAAGQGDYSLAIATLEKARKLNATQRLVNLSREYMSKIQSQNIKTDFQALKALLDSPAPQNEKIEKSHLFLEKYKNLSFAGSADLPSNTRINITDNAENENTENLALVSQIQDALDQMQVKTAGVADVAPEIITGYYTKLRRIEVPGLPEGIRVLGSIQLKLQVTAKGTIIAQTIDDTSLRISGQNQTDLIKQMIMRKLNSISLVPPRDKSSTPVKVKDWIVTFKVGTFQNKIILLNEGKND